MSGGDPVGAAASPALRRTARGRADLYRALIALEQATARPAGGREADWLARVSATVEDVVGEVDAHVEITEGADGLYEEIQVLAPRLGNSLDRLRGEHAEMRARAGDLARQLETATPEAASVDAIRDSVARLLGFLVKHRQRGSELVWQAYELDIGGVG